MPEILLGLLALFLLSALLWSVSRKATHNLGDPRGPIFTGPLPPLVSLPDGTVVAPAAVAPDRFSVVSFNVRFGYEAKSIASTLRSNAMDGADVVLLQESNEEAATRTAADLEMAFAYYPGAVHPHSRDFFGAAILSRWPIIAHRKILLPANSMLDAARKVAVAAVVTIRGVPIRIVSVHLQSGLSPRGFEAQLKTLMECAIDDDCHADHDPSTLPESRATVVGGDFNTWVGTLGRRLERTMVGYGLVPVEGIKGTFSMAIAGDRPKHTLDYFFATRDIIAGHGRVGADRTGSDHFPIAAEFRLPSLADDIKVLVTSTESPWPRSAP
jgi:endonuclease/exonuclease/phosphatase family metal-dependent hydrolase